MVRYAHFRGIVRGGPVFVNEKGSGCLVEIKRVTLHFGANGAAAACKATVVWILLKLSGVG